MIERSLVLLKPDAVQRGLTGRIISRFEDAGLKIIGMKMVWMDKDLSWKHYEEIGKVASRRGEPVLKRMVTFMTSGPVVAMCLEGIGAIEIIRKMVGATEPKAAAPGTIRGDFSHVSYAYADSKGLGIKNLIHASGDANDAKLELSLWFKPEELQNYKTVHETHTQN
jgi:nucleoside-diphosphate kinase